MEKPILCFFAPFVASQQFLKIFNLAGFFCFHQKLASDVKLLKYLAWQFFFRFLESQCEYLTCSAQTVKKQYFFKYGFGPCGYVL